MLLPEWLPGGYWLKVLSQPWEGDVTMVLPSMVWQIRKAISNPSKEELYESLKQARFHLLVLMIPLPNHAAGKLHTTSHSPHATTVFLASLVQILRTCGIYQRCCWRRIYLAGHADWCIVLCNVPSEWLVRTITSLIAC